MARKRKRETSYLAAPSPRPRIASDEAENPWVLVAVCILLFASTLLAFRPAMEKDVDFVNLDDNRYIYENDHVRQGLTPESISWAFTSLEYDNWHPLTWLSHMLDRQIFGPDSLQHPRGYHVTNVLIHAINVLVLFLALRWMTSALWPSLLVAVLFGIHPLRAESVAWLSERKDVLSGLFFLLTLWAYAAYARSSRSWVRYCLVIVCYIAGLMSKPMLVTLPVLLLLLDYWPLGRLRVHRAEIAPGKSQGPSTARILLEKAPLVMLAAASSVVTVLAQRGAMIVIDTITLRMRLENALVSYAKYIGELFCSVKLAPLYPFPEHGIPWTHVALAAAILATITGLVVLLRTWRWLAVGWLWYLVALLPVVGLVQVGVQAMADRYTYIPHIGLYIMLAWSAEELTANLPARRWIWALAMAALIPVSVQVTAAQTETWKNSETLWRSALKANPEIALAENNLGFIVQSQGQLDEAFRHYQHAVEIRPRYVEAHINLGNMYMVKRQPEEAFKHYRKAIEIRPDFEQSYVNLGTGLMLCGQLAEAEANFRTAIQKDPQYVEAYSKLGYVLCEQKKFEEAITALRRAVEIAPNYCPAWQTLGGVLCQQRRLDEGVAAFRRAIDLAPNVPLAQTLFSLGLHDEAIQCYEILLRQPAAAREATEALGYLHYIKRQPRKALEYWESVLNGNPDSLPVLTMSAWLLATDPDPAVRNGSKALTLARRAATISQYGDSRVLVALAAAAAECGDFTQAVKTLDQANRTLSRPLADQVMAELRSRYQAGSRYTDGIGVLLMKPDAGQK
jgi:protein O-mannosyl-transferase